MRPLALISAVALLALPLRARAQTASPAPGAATSPESTAASPAPAASDTTPAATTHHAASTAAVEQSPPPSTDAASQSVHATPPPDDLEARTTPIVDLHGYLRTRYEAFVNFGLGWENPSNSGINNPTGNILNSSAVYNSNYVNAHLPWYRNPDYLIPYCGNQPPAMAASSGMVTPFTQSYCPGAWQTSANIRMRLNPEIHPTDFIAVYAQIDLLDNLVLGSTPEGYYTHGYSQFAPLSAFSTTQVTPIFGYNSQANSIDVKRAWAEITNQNLGQIRFGRMPSHWGLGILANSGDGIDSDYQTTVDRVMYAARLRPYGLFGAVMYDFPSSGPTSASTTTEPGQGQPYDLSMAVNVYQLVAAVGRRLEPQQIRAALARNELVINGGAYFVYRWQNDDPLMNNGNSGMPTSGNLLYQCSSGGFATTCGNSFFYRDAHIFIPDIWLQLLGHDWRVEVEAVYVYGWLRALGNNDINTLWNINQFGGALETEYRTLNNRLILEFRTGYASGDPNVNALSYSSSGLTPPIGPSNNITLFSFNPDYRIDLIFWRQIMQQMSGAYYFRPSIGYNFIDEPGGDLLFARVDAIWSRASDFMQTRGHHSDLGVELDATVQYQTNHRRRDGTDNRPAPGFYANLQGGVFFPMGGLGPTDTERLTTFANFGFETAFTIRALLGVMF